MTKKRLGRLLALCLVVCMCISMFACRKQSEEQSTEPDGWDGTYQVTVTTETGMALEGIGVYIYADKEQTNLVWFAKTDAEGRISFTDTSSKSYVAVLKDVPAGHVVEEYYVIDSVETQIRLAMELIDEDALAGITMNLGDAMFDFAITAVDGTEYKLSELMAEKKAVVLNFWYLECAPCKAEFPYLQEAYENYSDDIAVLALNPVNQDPEAIAAYQQEMKLTFPMAQVTNSWESAMQLIGYPTTVVIDRYGMISFMHMGSVTDTDYFEDLFAFFSAEDYEHTVVESFEQIESEKEDGEFENPTEIGGVTSFQVQVEPGKVVYVDVYKIVGTRYLTIRDADAYVIYNNKTYTSTNGTVSVAVTSADPSTALKLGFGNDGEETKIFTVNFSIPAGTQGNPYTMNLGDVNVNVGAGNDQGVFYTYKAKEAGTLCISVQSVTSGVPYDIVLYNLNTYKYRNLNADGSKDESGKPMVSIPVRVGDSVQVTVGTLPDSRGSYPAATFQLKAYTGADDGSQEDEEVEKIIYSVTVTDESRKPVSGATVYLNIDGKETPFTTNESGVAATKLVPGTYEATLKVPSRYKANTTEFKLTEAIPNVSVKLDKKIVEMADYTIKVVDASGNPISGALVTMGSGFGYTDGNGFLTLNLDKDSYTAYVVAEGYTDGIFTFAEGVTAVTATMNAGSSSASGIDYTVKVVDYNGNAVKNVTVTFLKDGVYAGMKLVDASGNAVQKLAKGNYTVRLAFSGAYYYDEAIAVLTEEQTTLTIRVAEKCGTEGEELYVGGTSVGIASLVKEGATYLYDMQSNIVNYYLFEPTRSGTYQITTTDGAMVSNWGAATFPNRDDSTLANNVYTINVKEQMLGNTYVIGVTGKADTVLLVSRIGDAVLDESDIVADVYNGAGAPTKPYTVTGAAGKTLTYFDLTAGGYTLVLGSDGYYHLNSATGPLVYVNLGTTAPYIQFSNMLGVTSQYGTGFSKTFYDQSGSAVSKEDYTALMTAYCENMDETYGLYALNEDIMYMIQNGGEHKGWWDSENANYLFGDLSGLNVDIAWMFACCYFK